MATEPNPTKNRIIAGALALLPEAGPSRRLAPLLFARPPADDLAAFAPEALAKLTDEAAGALERHRPGRAVVSVRRLRGELRAGEPVTAITIAHDDMPFLFDSVIAEIADRAPAIHEISHPILSVERGADGAPLSFAERRPGAAGGEPVSLIQVVIEPMPDPAAEEALARNLEAILGEVAVANADFAAMRARVGEAARTIEARAGREANAERAASEREGAALVDWLANGNFIFLGLREFAYHPEGEALRRVEESDLGILRDPAVRVLRREGAAEAPSPELRAFLEDPEPLIVAKANSRSRVHRRAYMDYVGIKLRDADGKLTGELRVVGLFASSAYTQPLASIPYLRAKAATVTERLGFSPNSHSGKALAVALETYSRDEMFQIDVDLLERFVSIVTELGERPRIRVLPRIDRFDRFVSVLVFVPRERYDARLRDEIGVLLAERYDGHVSAYYPNFPEGALASIHFIIGRSGGPTPEPDEAELEAEIAAIARDWSLAFERAAARAGRIGELTALAPGLPGGYRDAVDPQEAVEDAARILDLRPGAPLGIDFYRREGDEDASLRLKIFHLAEALPLSRRVPILENMGFSPLAEQTHEIARADGSHVWLHDMELIPRSGNIAALADKGLALEATLQAVVDGRIEDDAFNALVFSAGLDWREANVLRAYARYLRQTGFATTAEFMAQVLERQPGVARALIELFAGAFDPAREHRPDALPEELAGDAEAAQAAARGALLPLLTLRQALDAITSLDEDRVVRRLMGAVLATLRTNFYAVPDVSADPNSVPTAVKPALAFKIDPHRIEGMPAPVPYREIFVFDARVEGVHLRFGPVARGGLRWSDRSQDYRTEILGLVKAQQVKNAVIVPVGSKGGFYPKRLADASNREAWFESGRAAYVVFIASLLSVTDNIEPSGETVTPTGVIAYDDLDPYFVVAADKGTATFSDTANAVARARGFWLDDAFASGGSAGYDHKAMGITARGAWEAVKRHFREMGRDGRAWDIQSEPFTVAGCGDMSGDVFGNGMLLSRKIRLVAAFDHRDIFIDPNPDEERSFNERQRLFALPRSSWADFDRSVISTGGGVFSRRDKLIRLSPEAAAAIGLDKTSGTPAEIITAILKAPVDLLWFGGIGTYIRASTETNLDVGDRANDPVRIAGREVRAKVIGEGANLGLTQGGRIEAARSGVRLNTDAIDNSAGVNTSDVEVNFKIALRQPLAEGRLSREERDRLLGSMTDEVARLVLANNYAQTLAISLEERAGVSRLALQARLMAALEETGALDRQVETLPSPGAIADLRARGQSLSRPELAVLLAYAKIDLFNTLVSGSLPDDPYLASRLMAYFPTALREKFEADISAHRLRREIVATGLANAFVNHLGVSFATVLRDATGRSGSHLASAYVAIHDGFAIDDLLREIDALDARLPGAVQNDLYAAVSFFLQVGVVGLVRSGAFDLGETVAALRRLSAEFGPALVEMASEHARADFAARQSAWVSAGVPEELATRIARLPLLALVPDVERVSRETGRSFGEAMRATFALTQALHIGQLEEALVTLRPTDYYETLALERAGSQIARERKRLTILALNEGKGEDPVADWAAAEGDTLRAAAEQLQRLAGTGETSVSRLTLAAGLLQDVGL
ncbi:NAD-glutamate dehydrogenase [Aureimonas sp. Leaf324]|uniref:NAD-glutamate dehydrogenase n=1 Tax=Aureimonas sp. Leaf324 TaxID=1736336 RepID=UPI0006FDC832|nr:NAD-glutamate dehydrogenase [Aureimonas sp. Leaf324]KQQ89571.1 NAD-glutamate dehydrogenase [Aureimonas sp. Leaf324]